MTSQYCLLGTPAVSVDEVLVEVRSSRDCIVLSMLLLHANQVVPVNGLVDAIWHDHPPATARSQIQHCISSLRHQLAELGTDGEIATTTTGYRFSVQPDAIDVGVFERLVRQGRLAVAEGQAESAILELRGALALWRGPACAGVASEMVQAVATRLNEDRLRALEDCLELEFDLGRHRDLVGELSELVRQHPMRERLRAQHMLALYRSARKAEALTSFMQARAVLVDELGIEPGEELCALQRAILADDQGLDFLPEVATRWKGSAVIPRQLPSATADFTGRTSELARITALLTANDDIPADYLPVIVLTGRGGAGKTTLAVRAAHLLHGAYPHGQLFARLKDAEGEPISPFEIIGQFLRSLGAATPLPQSLAERAGLYRSLVADRRMMIVLDDADSVQQATPLLPGNPACGVLITSRSQLAGLPGASYLEIEDLDEQTSLELLGNLIGARRVSAEPEEAKTIVRLCGYLPLAIRIVSGKLAERPHWRLDQMVRRMTDESRRLDELSLGGVTIRATLSMSYRSIDADSQRLFRRLGVLGTSEFSPWVCAPLLNTEMDMVTDVLDVLVQARLVEVRLCDPGPPRFHLHELVRVYALECLANDEPAAQRSAALERLLSCWLGLAIEAHRRSYGGDHATMHGNAKHFVLPQQVLDALLARPLEWLHAEQTGLVTAVIQAAQVGLDDLCWDLALALVALFESEYQADNWRRTHLAALEATRHARNMQGEAAVLCSLGVVSISGDLSQAGQYFHSAHGIFEQLGHGHGIAMSLAGLAFVDRIGGQLEQALHRYELAMAGFAEAGDRIGEIDSLTSMAQIHADLDDFDVAHQLLEKARRNCGTLAAPRIKAQTEYRLAELLLRTGEYQDAERSFSYVLQIVREASDLVGEAYALLGLANVHAGQGRYTTAEAEYEAALSLSARIGDGLLRGRILLASAEMYARTNQSMLAISRTDSALAQLGGAGVATVWQVRAMRLRTQLAASG